MMNESEQKPEPMILEVHLPRKVVSLRLRWLKRDFAVMSPEYRAARAKVGGGMDECFTCGHPFEDGEPFGLGQVVGRGNRTFCRACMGGGALSDAKLEAALAAVRYPNGPEDRLLREHGFTWKQLTRIAKRAEWPRTSRLAAALTDMGALAERLKEEVTFRRLENDEAEALARALKAERKADAARFGSFANTNEAGRHAEYVYGCARETTDAALAALGTPDPAEFGWLLERLDENGNGEGLALGLCSKQGPLDWDFVPYDKALRFARKEDAEAAGVRLLLVAGAGRRWKAIEHAWAGLRPPAEPVSPGAPADTDSRGGAGGAGSVPLPPVVPDPALPSGTLELRNGDGSLAARAVNVGPDLIRTEEELERALDLATTKDVVKMAATIRALWAWKESVLVLERTWDEQAVGRELGVGLGLSIRDKILPAVCALRARAEAAERRPAAPAAVPAGPADPDCPVSAGGLSERRAAELCAKCEKRLRCRGRVELPEPAAEPPAGDTDSRGGWPVNPAGCTKPSADCPLCPHFLNDACARSLAEAPAFRLKREPPTAAAGAGAEPCKAPPLACPECDHPHSNGCRLDEPEAPPCDRCGGSGFGPAGLGNLPTYCPACNGSGRLPAALPPNGCKTCNGSGRVNVSGGRHVCPVCLGAGVLPSRDASSRPKEEHLQPDHAAEPAKGNDEHVPPEGKGKPE